MKKRMIAIKISDWPHPFTDMIFCGLKTEEVRSGRLLHEYCNIPLVVIRTSKGKNRIVGTLELERARPYRNKKQFRAGYEKHRVPPDSRFDIRDGRCKYAYTIKNAVKIEDDIEFTVIEKYGKTACLIEFDDGESEEYNG